MCAYSRAKQVRTEENMTKCPAKENRYKKGPKKKQGKKQTTEDDKTFSVHPRHNDWQLEQTILTQLDANCRFSRKLRLQ